MNENFSLEDIKRYCLQYDKESGIYPESELEGFSIYEFILQKIDSSLGYNIYVWKKEIKNV